MNAKREAFVAAYVGEARWNASRAAEVAGYSKPGQEGHRLLKDAEIQGAIQEYRDQVKASAITDLTYRVARLAELENKLWTVVDERANDRQYADVAGGNTGLIVHTIKSVGSGPSATLVDEYGVDTPLVKAIQSLYEDVAKEMGQRTEKVDVTGSFTRRVIVELPQAEGAD